MNKNKQSPQEVKSNEKNSGFFGWFKKLYGLRGDENEDLEFIYTSYSNANESPSKRSNVLFLFIISFVSIAIVWAAVAELDELARGNGKVIPTDKIQKVQSLDGGIISEILVKEGQIVKKGAPIMKIDTTRFQATLEESKQEYLSLLAIKERLMIEANLDLNKDLPELTFPEEVIQDKSRYDILEKTLLINRFNELKSSVRVLETQVGQKEQELKEIENTIKNLSKSYKLIKEQRVTIQQLVNRGVKSKYELLDIEKEFNKVAGDLEAALLSVKRSKLAISEAKNRMAEKINSFKAEASNTLQKTASEINKFEARLVGDKDKVAKTTITSPVDGIVKQLYYNTIGGVVQPGVDLIEIVPESNLLVVEAKIDPRDIAFINPSQKAIIKITAYDFSIYGGLDGQIIEISADSIIDKESKEGKSYYRVLVKAEKNYLERNGVKLPIIPGMVASVDIITGKKTILDFILKPILKAKQNSMHER
ncbi:MAG: HlyD family type I secretion periplasmic adaptor subunit [Arcobacter sp.]|uniref:HlyD family type I secretion periplasmic adaptor subunit n=1 Tax=uncultured Arcobacter sp. TaxID=165434 RepID=UPI000CC1D332|nr:HlyD family type I secretion periplasmic adaptor subunit [uncultured Arcobacter sp.]PLY10457.1 MAG: HlyD family type I secretion periplasmic adaptor subunit [Arcobacter sp.]